MTDKRDNANQEALEALVAASLRCPDKRPGVTHEEIKRFVEDRVTLSAEDEAALTRSHGDLMRRVQRAPKGVVQRVAEFIEEFSPAACVSQQPNRTSPTGLTNADLDPANHQ